MVSNLTEKYKELEEGIETLSFEQWKEFLDSKKFKELNIFSETQRQVLRDLLDFLWWRLEEWHNQEDDESHKDIRKKVEKLDARLRNHRHEYSRAFTGKAEY